MATPARNPFARRLTPRIVVLCALVLLVPTLVVGFSLPPIPGLLFYSSSESDSPQNGVMPDSGASGTTFNFYVSYTEAGASPGIGPSKYDLLIDLDGDGIVGGVVTPFHRPPEFPWAALTLIPLGLLVLILITHSSRVRPAFTHAGVALAVVLLVIGCNGAGGDVFGTAEASHGGLALASCSSPMSEVIPMTDGGGDYTLGVEFTASVTLTCELGIVLYMFDFEGPAMNPITIGNAVNLHTLRITP